MSRRIPALKIKVPMTNKISVIKELGVLTHMPDEDSLTVRGYLIWLRKGLTEYRFLTKSSIWRVRNILCRCNGLFLIDMPHWQCSPGNVRPGIYAHFLSLTDSFTATEAGMILSAFGSWLQALWELGDSGGPSMLFQPTGLSTTIQAW